MKRDIIFCLDIIQVYLPMVTVVVMGIIGGRIFLTKLKKHTIVTYPSHILYLRKKIQYKVREIL